MRIARVLPATLCVLLLTAMPALTEPVKINQVVQTLSSSGGAPDLRLNTLVAQDPGTTKGTQPGAPRGETGMQGSSQVGGKTESLISGVIVTSQDQIGVEVTEEGEVEGTICDCGEILIAGAGFAKWPFLFLAAVPLVFINECDDCDENPISTPTPTPPPNATPTPTPPEIPEPASLLLFGTGLAAFGAGLRRRYAKSKVVEPIKSKEDE